MADKLEKYIIVNVGCDDETRGVFEFTKSQYEFLKSTFDKLNKNSEYGCMPKIYIEKGLVFHGCIY